MNNKIIMYNSPEAASIETVTGWVNGTQGGYSKHFYGDNEHSARWAGCTHIKCECGKVRSKSYTICEDCRNKEAVERYNAMPFKEWDFIEPVCIVNTDTYFFDVDHLRDYMDEEELKTIDLVICDPIPYNKIDFEDLTGGECHEDWEPSSELVKKVDEFNKFLATLYPHSWKPGKTRTSYTL